MGASARRSSAELSYAIACSRPLETSCPRLGIADRDDTRWVHCVLYISGDRSSKCSRSYCNEVYEREGRYQPTVKVVASCYTLFGFIVLSRRASPAHRISPG